MSLPQLAGATYSRLDSAFMREPMTQRDCLDVTLTMRDGSNCRKISVSFRTRIYLYRYLISAVMRKPTHDTNREEQQQMSEDQH